MPAEAAIVDPPTPQEPPSTKQFISNASSKFRTMMDTGEKPAAAPIPAPEAPEPKSAIPEPKTDKNAPTVKPEAKNQDSSENFKRLNADFDKFRGESERRQKELEAALAEKDTKYTGELEGTKKQLEQYEQLVSRFYVEHSDKFKAAFDVPIEQRITEAKEAVGAKKAEALDEILSMKPGETRSRKIKELAADLDEYEKIGLNNAYRDLTKLQKERSAALDKSKQDAKHLYDYERQEQITARTAQQRRTESIFNEELGKFSKILPEFRPDESNPEHHKLALENIQTAKQWLGSDLTAPENIARLVLYAVKGNASIATDKARDAKIAMLEEQIVQMTQGNPGIGGGTPNKDGKQSADSAGDKFRKAMAGGHAAAA